jgi:hypothetical protein
MSPVLLALMHSEPQCPILGSGEVSCLLGDKYTCKILADTLLVNNVTCDFRLVLRQRVAPDGSDAAQPSAKDGSRQQKVSLTTSKLV